MRKGLLLLLLIVRYKLDWVSLHHAEVNLSKTKHLRLLFLLVKSPLQLDRLRCHGHFPEIL